MLLDCAFAHTKPHYHKNGPYTPGHTPTQTALSHTPRFFFFFFSLPTFFLSPLFLFFPFCFPLVTPVVRSLNCLAGREVSRSVLQIWPLARGELREVANFQASTGCILHWGWEVLQEDGSSLASVGGQGGLQKQAQTLPIGDLQLCSLPPFLNYHRLLSFTEPLFGGTLGFVLR